jgi:hypothetical protein
MMNRLNFSVQHACLFVYIMFHLDIVAREEETLSLVAEDMDVWTHRVAQQLMNPLSNEEMRWTDLDLQTMSEQVNATWNSMLFTFNIQSWKTQMGEKEMHHTRGEAPSETLQNMLSTIERGQDSAI